MSEIYDDVDECWRRAASNQGRETSRRGDEKADTGEEKVKGGNWPSWEGGQAFVVERSF